MGELCLNFAPVLRAALKSLAQIWWKYGAGLSYTRCDITAVCLGNLPRFSTGQKSPITAPWSWAVHNFESFGTMRADERELFHKKLEEYPFLEDSGAAWRR